MQYVFLTATSGDPGAGNFLYNNGTIASVTAINFANVDAKSVNQAPFLLQFDNSTTTASRGYLLIRDNNNGVARMDVFKITGATVDNSTYKTIAVAYVSGTLPTASEQMATNFSRTGDLGATGATGGTGPTGPTGPTGATGIPTSIAGFINSVCGGG